MKKKQHQPKTIGLIGTVTKDYITFESRSIPNRIGMGGILYQAAALCGMGHQVQLITQIGEELLPEFNNITHKWKNLITDSLYTVPGPGNQVHLFYPISGERKEVLVSYVPPLTSGQIIPFLTGLDMLVLVINSGFDISLKDWKDSLKKAACPVWMDVHSLVLAKKIGAHREYIAFSEWQDWVEGAAYLQANKKEVSAALGNPKKTFGEQELLSFGSAAFNRKVSAVFVTLGKDGVMFLTPGHSRKIRSSSDVKVLDTTGCGDVFCAAAVDSLLNNNDFAAAAKAGVKLAVKAAETAGVEEIYNLAGDI